MLMRKRKFLTAAAAAALSVGVSAQTRPTAGAASQEDIVLGASVPLTGVFAFAGIGIDQGIKDYLQMLNEGGGVKGRKVKYIAEDTQYICPGLTGAAEEDIRALALEAFNAAGCFGWGRVDVMRDRAGNNYLLEVNTAPGMTSHSLVPKAAQARGISFEQLVWRVLETSMEPGGRA